MFTEVNDARGRTIVMKRTYATLEASKIDFTSFRGSGRILEYDVYSKQTIVLMAKLNFPNGLVIKKTEVGKTTLVFSETMRARLIEIDLTTDVASYEPLKLWTGKGFDHKGGL
jgi:sugar lactone lactonase YvrE